jgi:cobalt/nickel transport system permease protein
MINFPIVGGTSGHLVGATLLSILFGPYAAIVSITIILVIQAFMFGDGGITALGANVINMGVVAVFSGYLIYKVITRLQSKRTVTIAGAFAVWWVSAIIVIAVLGANVFNIVIAAVFSGVVALFSGYLIYRMITKKTELVSRRIIASAASFIGAYVSVVLAAFVCGIEIGISSAFPYGLDVTIPMMVFWHLIIGIGEGLITMLILGVLMRTRPDIVNLGNRKQG